MGAIDFPTWFSAGSYGGLVFSLLAAAAIAAFALRLRRGTPRQLARAMLVSLVYACLMFAPIWWSQARFDLLGPTLSPDEVAFWLAWTALLGWALPLGTACGYILLARPQPLTGAVPVPAHAPGRSPAVSSHPSALDDPGRLVEPLGSGRAWGRLVPIGGPFAERPVPLTRQVTLLGREADCDIVVPDDQASRHHAEVRWDHGRVHLVDRGSLNGTRVNGQGVLGQVPLREHDVIEIGSQRYRLEVLPASAAASTAEDQGEETRKVPGAFKPISGGLVPLPSATLVALSGPRPGARWELAGPLATIGREPTCEISLPDSSVSRRHAQVVRQPSGIYVQDLDSQNGTLLNGRPLAAPAPLRPGDVLQVGEVALRCEPSRATPAPAPAASPRSSVPSGPRVRSGSSATPPPPGASASNPGALAAPVLPNTNTLLSPQPHAADRPHLAPPRLLPSQVPDGQ
jgi:pSer/pThr/pTyr-binding forkhead associated (FHA) protein